MSGADKPGLEQLLRKYAEHPCPVCQPPLRDEVTIVGCVTCQGSGFDPRFAPLRGEHDPEVMNFRLCRRCGVTLHGDDWADAKSYAPYCLRTDLGALARVAAACGGEVLGKVLQRIDDGYSIGGFWQEEPEDAAALALVAAVPLPERAS